MKSKVQFVHMPHTLETSSVTERVGASVLALQYASLHNSVFNLSVTALRTLLILVNPLPARQQGTGKGVVMKVVTLKWLFGRLKQASNAKDGVKYVTMHNLFHLR